MNALINRIAFTFARNIRRLPRSLSQTPSDSLQPAQDTQSLEQELEEDL
jgi:hypothetical protein